MKAEVSSQTNYTEISLNGRFDHTATRGVRDAMIEALGHSQTEIRINLATIEYIDSTALGMLLMIREMAESAGKTVTLANARGMVGKALDVVMFKNLFRIV